MRLRKMSVTVISMKRTKKSNVLDILFHHSMKVRPCFLLKSLQIGKTEKSASGVKSFSQRSGERLVLFNSSVHFLLNSVFIFFGFIHPSTA